jgi:hypothetical protein
MAPSLSDADVLAAMPATVLTVQTRQQPVDHFAGDYMASSPSQGPLVPHLHPSTARTTNIRGAVI